VLGQRHERLDVVPPDLAHCDQFVEFFSHIGCRLVYTHARHYDGVNFQTPREIAFRLLRQREAGGVYLEHLIEQELPRAGLAPRDRALAHEIACGAVRWQATLDWLIDRRTGGRRQVAAVRQLLRLGLYQLFWLDRVPDHAAVNETVQLARRAGLHAQAGFVNAVLRGYARERAATLEALEDLRRTDPALGHSHPAWLVDRWTVRWGPETARSLLEWNNTPPRTFARLNTLRTDAGRLLERWRAEGVTYDFGRWDWIPENLVFELKDHPPLTALGSFREGWFYVQDPSTLLAVRTLEATPATTVLDLCAAPGGKTTFLAQGLENAGRVLAGDLGADRLELLRANCRRLGVGNVELLAPPADPDHPPPIAERFDRVLLDTPCSNTGALRRRVDLRWRLSPGELQRLTRLQEALLDRALGCLKPDGRLVYSTCSLEPEENEDQMAAVRSRHPEIECVSMRTLRPFAESVDGAFVAVLRRSSGML